MLSLRRCRGSEVTPPAHAIIQSNGQDTLLHAIWIDARLSPRAVGLRGSSRGARKLNALGGNGPATIEGQVSPAARAAIRASPRQAAVAMASSLLIVNLNLRGSLLSSP